MHYELFRQYVPPESQYESINDNRVDHRHLPLPRGTGCCVGGIGAVCYLLPFYGRSGTRIKLLLCISAARNIVDAYSKHPNPKLAFTLPGTEQTLCIAAIVDSGNTLTEPMSGAPVSVLDVVTFQTLWPEWTVRIFGDSFTTVSGKNGILYGAGFTR